MNGELQQQLLKRFNNRFSKYNEKVLYELGQVISQFREITPSEAYKLAQQLKYNMTVEDLERELSKLTGKSIKEIRVILEHIARENIAFAKPFYEAKGLDVPIYESHKELQKIISSISQVTTDNFINIARSTGFKLLDSNKNPMLLNIEETYHKVIDEALYAITTGKDTYNQQMRGILKQLSASGVRAIEYESGYSRRLDSAIKMNLSDAMTQISNEISRQFGEEFGSDGVEITNIQTNPAPDHEDIQGHQFSNEEFEKFQSHLDCVDYKGNFIDHICNGQERRNISEYNCRHTISRIVLGVSEPLHTDEELNQIIEDNRKGVEIEGIHYSKYEAQQLLRRIETEIRKSKEQQLLAESAKDEELVMQSQTGINQLRHKYTKITRVLNVSEDVNQIYVPGYKTKNIKRSEIASESKCVDVTNQWLEKATPNSHEIADLDYWIIDNNKMLVDGKNIVLDYKKDGEEYKCAEWLKNTFGGEIFMCPRINEPKGIETPDYLYRKEFWDLKSITGDGKHTLDSSIKKKKNQANNFILDITNSKIPKEEAIRQLDLIFKSRDRNWINKIILKKNKDVIVILEHKKRD